MPLGFRTIIQIHHLKSKCWLLIRWPGCSDSLSPPRGPSSNYYRSTHRHYSVLCTRTIPTYSKRQGFLTIPKLSASTAFRTLRHEKVYLNYVEILQKNQLSKQYTKDFSIDCLKDKIMFLESMGCQPIEVFEYPKIFQMTNEELIAAKQKLEYLGFDQVSVQLLKAAHSSDSADQLSLKIAEMESAMGGCHQKSEMLRKVLRISSDELELLSPHLPRLFEICLMTVQSKVHLMQGYGITVNQILQHCNILYNIPLSTLQNRLAELKGFHIAPIPVAALGQSERNFRSRINSILNKGRAKYLKLQFLESLQLPMEHDHLMQSLGVLNKVNFVTLQPKIDFLFGKEFTGRDIFECSQILLHSLSKLVSGYSDLTTLSLESITLQDLNNYIHFKKLCQGIGVSRLKLAKLLSWNLKEVQISTSDALLFRGLDSESMLNIYFFLKSVGFLDEHIQSLPLILTHEYSCIKNAWSALLEKNNPKIANNKKVLLNLLQYYLEKERNFSVENMHQFSKFKMLKEY